MLEVEPVQRRLIVLPLSGSETLLVARVTVGTTVGTAVWMCVCMCV